jgi:division protein CdvB (Snf7/Vps24/ESCRT-III family)
MTSDLASTTILGAKLLIAIDAVKSLTAKIKELEEDMQTPVIQKLSQIKKIKEELSKVGTEIDMIKKSIKLLSDYHIN